MLDNVDLRAEIRKVVATINVLLVQAGPDRAMTKTHIARASDDLGRALDTLPVVIDDRSVVLPARELAALRANLNRNEGRYPEEAE